MNTYFISAQIDFSLVTCYIRIAHLYLWETLSRAGNSYFGMDGARPEPGLIGVEDGGDVLQLPLRQLPVVGQQHRGGALHWRRSWTLQAGGILVKCF